jgi:hypothetical protein
VGAVLVDIAIASIMLFVIMPVYGVGFHASLLMFVPLVALTAVVAAAVGIWTSALNVKYLTSVMLCRSPTNIDVSDPSHLSCEFCS